MARWDRPLDAPGQGDAGRRRGALGSVLVLLALAACAAAAYLAWLGAAWAWPLVAAAVLFILSWIAEARGARPKP